MKGDNGMSSAEFSLTADIETAFSQNPRRPADSSLPVDFEAAFKQREETKDELDASIRSVRQLTEDEIRAVRSGSKVRKLGKLLV